jgi:hypothetical protein
MMELRRKMGGVHDALRKSEAMTNPTLAALAQARFQLSCHSQGNICQGWFLTGMADAVMVWQSEPASRERGFRLGTCRRT